VDNDVVLGTTVEDKINTYTVREYLNAKKSCELQNIIGRPSTNDLINYIDKNMIPNFSVTRQDILRAKDIFGLNIILLKGKTTHTTQEAVEINIHNMLWKLWRDTEM